MIVKPDARQKLVDQRTRNCQTLTHVADEQANIASQADALVRDDPQQYMDLQQVAALEREHRKTLMEVARAEQRLATMIQLEGDAPQNLAAREREHRKDLLEIARAEERLAHELTARGQDDPTLAVMAEQALRNRDLLREVARTEAEAIRALREEQAGPGPSGP